MKESTHKLKEKSVGADASVRPFFKGIPKDDKGITLIALIITIIVMMILVAVTVTFTIGENGILSQAKESAKLAERAQLHEQIMGAMKLTSEGKIKIGESYTAAKEMLLMQGYEVDDLQADGTFEVTGKKGTYKYKITETEIKISDEENRLPENEGEDEEIIISAEKDLTVAMYQYLTMYNPEQPEINSAEGHYDDENGDGMYDGESTLGAYIKGTYFNIEKKFFEPAISEPGDITGNITAKITHFDGTVEEITLTTTDNQAWIYESEGSPLTGIDNIYIGFRPLAKFNSNLKYDEIDQYKGSDEYHYMYIEGEVAVPFYKLEMLEKEIEFPYNCQCIIGNMNIETGESLESMYNNIDDVSRIIVNLSDGSKKEYTKENIFDAASYTGEFVPHFSQENPVSYADGMFVINMSEPSLKTQISSVIVEENGMATKYNVTDSTMVVHMRPGT